MQHLTAFSLILIAIAISLCLSVHEQTDDLLLANAQHYGLGGPSPSGSILEGGDNIASKSWGNVGFSRKNCGYRLKQFVCAASLQHVAACSGVERANCGVNAGCGGKCDYFGRRRKLDGNWECSVNVARHTQAYHRNLRFASLAKLHDIVCPCTGPNDLEAARSIKQIRNCYYHQWMIVDHNDRN